MKSSWNRYMLFCFIVLNAIIVHGQKNKQEKEIRATVDSLFLAMKKGDAELLLRQFDMSSDVRMQTVFQKKDSTIVHQDQLADFAEAVGTPREETWDERISNVKILIDFPMAVVWAPYSFYLNDVYSHQGVNVFELVYTENRWKIISITDTRRK